MNINDMTPCPRCAGAPGKDPTKTGGRVSLPDDPAAPGEKHFAFDVRCELCNGSGYISKGLTLTTFAAAKAPSFVAGIAAFHFAYHLVSAKAEEGSPLGARLTFAGTAGPTTTVTSVSGFLSHGYVYVQTMPNMIADEPIKLDPAPPAWWGKLVVE